MKQPVKCWNKQYCGHQSVKRWCTRVLKSATCEKMRCKGQWKKTPSKLLADRIFTGQHLPCKIFASQNEDHSVQCILYCYAVYVEFVQFATVYIFFKEFIVTLSISHCAVSILTFIMHRLTFFPSTKFSLQTWCNSLHAFTDLNTNHILSVSSSSHNSSVL